MPLTLETVQLITLTPYSNNATVCIPKGESERKKKRQKKSQTKGDKVRVSNSCLEVVPPFRFVSSDQQQDISSASMVRSIRLLRFSVSNLISHFVNLPSVQLFLWFSRACHPSCLAQAGGGASEVCIDSPGSLYPSWLLLWFSLCVSPFLSRSGSWRRCQRGVSWGSPGSLYPSSLLLWISLCMSPLLVSLRLAAAVPMRCVLVPLVPLVLCILPGSHFWHCLIVIRGEGQVCWCLCLQTRLWEQLQWVLQSAGDVYEVPHSDALSSQCSKE